MRLIDLVVVHCTATPAGRTVTVAEVDRWHKARGFNQIGYHYLIGLDGTVERGRQDWQIGAHVAGWNTSSIGICYVGGLDKSGFAKDTRTEAQKAAILTLLRDLLVKYPTIERIAGHNEFANKACPCFEAGLEYAPLLTGETEWTPPKETTPDLILGDGDFGPLVREWQEKLRKFAYPAVDVDGDFGPATEEATRWFQHTRGIVADGLVGPQTSFAMTEALEALSI